MYGNTNVTAVGPLERPKVKLGGGGGGCNISATINQLTLWTTRHRSGRTVVAACDFITDIGHRTPAGTRHELDYTGGGPQWLVSELGVFDYDSEGRMRLQELWPDVTVEQVQEATGFEFAVADEITSVAPPTQVELDVLRSIDPLGVRRGEFDPREIEREFELLGAGI
jgi:glutaconate CoA-transferase subunit B